MATALVTAHDDLDAGWDTAGSWHEVVTVPVDTGLATVIDLDAHREARRPTPATFRRRRLSVVAGLLASALVLALAFGPGAADAELSDPVAGTVSLAPGETLWDVAEAHKPEGVTTAEYLRRMQDLNDFPGGSLPAWTVVLLPQR